MTIKVLSTEEICRNWRTIRELLTPALVDCKDYDIEVIERNLLKDQWQLYAVYDDSKMIGAVVVSFVPTIRDTIAFITAIGGRGLIDLYEQFFAMLKAAGAGRVQGAGKPSIVRLWRRIGMTEEYAIVERTL